jgi:hypothetical protein
MKSGEVGREQDGSRIGRRRYSYSREQDIQTIGGTFGGPSEETIEGIPNSHLTVDWEGDEASIVFGQPLILKAEGKCLKFTVTSSTGAVRASGGWAPCKQKS